MAGESCFDVAHRTEKLLISLWKANASVFFQAYKFPLLENMICKYCSFEHGLWICCVITALFVKYDHNI